MSTAATNTIWPAIVAYVLERSTQQEMGASEEEFFRVFESPERPEIPLYDYLKRLN